MSSGRPCATCLLLGEALFLPCCLAWGVPAPGSTGYDQVLALIRQREGPPDAASTACGFHACVWIELPNMASLSICVPSRLPHPLLESLQDQQVGLS